MRLFLIAIVMLGCAAKTPSIHSMPSPAPVGAAEPFLFAARDGSVLLSWLEPVGDRHALRFSRYVDGKWSTPRTIVERNDLFVNWADFPSIVEDAKGALFVHWLQKSGAGTYSYDVRMAVSRDRGATWSAPFLLNRDGTQSEHGFVSLAALPKGGVGAAWLDGRHMPGGGDMTIRYATVDANGRIANDVELDRRTCECCATGMTMTSRGPVIVYRDRSHEDIRDISVVRPGAAPRAVRNDGWKIDGCPVNGPQIDATGKAVATAWFTAANEKQRVYASFDFGKAIVVDGGKPAGRVDVEMLDEDTAVVSWLEQTPAGAEIRARRVHRDGKVDAAMKIADASTSRGAGFTRIAKVNDEIWFSWTVHDGKTKQIRLARARF